jgi:hypothetical protein
MHEYSIEFRVMVPGLVEEDTLTEAIGLKPSHFLYHEKDHLSVWGFNGGETREAIYWTDLSQGLEFVLDKLEPHHGPLREFIKTYRCIWWCGHFHSAFDGGPNISPVVLKRLSEFGVELFIDTYCNRSPRRISTQ